MVEKRGEGTYLDIGEGMEHVFVSFAPCLGGRDDVELCRAGWVVGGSEGSIVSPRGDLLAAPADDGFVCQPHLFVHRLCLQNGLCISQHRLVSVLHNVVSCVKPDECCRRNLPGSPTWSHSGVSEPGVTESESVGRRGNTRLVKCCGWDGTIGLGVGMGVCDGGSFRGGCGGDGGGGRDVGERDDCV